MLTAFVIAARSVAEEEEEEEEEEEIEGGGTVLSVALLDELLAALPLPPFPFPLLLLLLLLAVPSMGRDTRLRLCVLEKSAPLWLGGREIALLSEGGSKGYLGAITLDMGLRALYSSKVASYDACRRKGRA